jgi:hypothetical protein
MQWSLSPSIARGGGQPTPKAPPRSRPAGASRRRPVGSRSPQAVQDSAGFHLDSYPGQESGLHVGGSCPIEECVGGVAPPMLQGRIELGKGCPALHYRPWWQYLSSIEADRAGSGFALGGGPEDPVVPEGKRLVGVVAKPDPRPGGRSGHVGIPQLHHLGRDGRSDGIRPRFRRSGESSPEEEWNGPEASHPFQKRSRQVGPRIPRVRGPSNGPSPWRWWFRPRPLDCRHHPPDAGRLPASDRLPENSGKR